MPYVLNYAEWRPASDNPNVPIGERKEHLISEPTEAEAQIAADRFLKDGAYQCGGKMYPRCRIGALLYMRPMEPLPGPRADMVPTYESN